MKILLTAPTSEHKDYCLQAWAKWITAPEFSAIPFDILIVDNSQNKNYYKVLEKAFKNKATIIKYRPKKGESIQQIISASNEMLRKYFLKNKYDYMFFNESDIFAPRNSIELLVKHNVDLIALPYFTGQHYQSVLIDKEPVPTGRVREVNQMTLMKSFINFDGQVQKVHHTGNGALMIKRQVLEKATWQMIEKNDAFADSHFLQQSVDNNFTLLRANKHICEHANARWEEILGK